MSPGHGLSGFQCESHLVAPKLPAPPVSPAGDPQTTPPAAAKGAPPAAPEKERNLLHANAYLYRAVFPQHILPSGQVPETKHVGP